MLWDKEQEVLGHKISVIKMDGVAILEASVGVVSVGTAFSRMRSWYFQGGSRTIPIVLSIALIRFWTLSMPIVIILCIARALTIVTLVSFIALLCICIIIAIVIIGFGCRWWQ